MSANEMDTPIIISSLSFFDMDTNAKFITSTVMNSTSIISFAQIMSNGVVGITPASTIGQTFSIILSGQYKKA